MLFSIIVPVFNRPDELHALLESLTAQTCKNFEVIVIDDGSELRSAAVALAYTEQLSIRYHHIANIGPGKARNYGCDCAVGDYFIFFDSDCIVPPQYIRTVSDHLDLSWLDAYGGPDAAHPSFTPLQRAISHSMTSFLTTGGLRGRRRRIGAFHPRSFNMGISRHVYEQIGGFPDMHPGEDIDLSLRIIRQGFATGLIAEAFVYHMRRDNLRKFFKQVYNFGLARIDLLKRHSRTLRAAHVFPVVFTLGYAALPVTALLSPTVFVWVATFYLAYACLVFADAWRQQRSLAVAALSVAALQVQLIGYGAGFLYAVWQRLIRGRPELTAFRRNFHK